MFFGKYQGKIIAGSGKLESAAGVSVSGAGQVATFFIFVMPGLDPKSGLPDLGNHHTYRTRVNPSSEGIPLGDAVRSLSGWPEQVRP